MSTREPGSVEQQLVAAYLEQVARYLQGSAARQRDILDELEHGLHETVRAHLRREHDPTEAARAAIAEFGHARLIGTAHASEIRLQQVHRDGWMVLCLLVVASVMWYAYRSSVGDLSFAVPAAGWARQAFFALTVTMPIVPGIAQLAALALTITSGRVAPTHRRGRAIIHWLTLALSAAMGLMLINMVAIVALMAWTPVMRYHWFVYFVLLAMGMSAFTLSVLAARRARAL